MNIDYEIKHPLLKGKMVSEAVKERKFKELIEVKKYLLASFNDDKNANYAKKILTGITSIEYYLCEEYSKLMMEFQNKYSKLSNAKKNEIVEIIKKNKQKLEENDILFIQDILKSIS